MNTTRTILESRVHPRIRSRKEEDTSDTSPVMHTHVHNHGDNLHSHPHPHTSNMDDHDHDHPKKG